MIGDALPFCRSVKILQWQRGAIACQGGASYCSAVVRNCFDGWESRALCRHRVKADEYTIANNAAARVVESSAREASSQTCDGAVWLLGVGRELRSDKLVWCLVFKAFALRVNRVYLRVVLVL